MVGAKQGASPAGGARWGPAGADPPPVEATRSTSKGALGTSSAPPRGSSDRKFKIWASDLKS
eukprot:13260221-Alexandrium_andersonii.AAC.1